MSAEVIPNEDGTSNGHGAVLRAYEPGPDGAMVTMEVLVRRWTLGDLSAGAAIIQELSRLLQLARAERVALIDQINANTHAMNGAANQIAELQREAEDARLFANNRSDRVNEDAHTMSRIRAEREQMAVQRDEAQAQYAAAQETITRLMEQAQQGPHTLI